MTDLDTILASIGAAPAGPSTAAFFDLDGTIIEGYTAEYVYRDRLRRFDVGLGELSRSTLAALDMRFRGAGLDKLVNVAFEALAGRMEDELAELGERLFRQDIASRVYPQARRLVEAHRRAGHRVVLATSATPFQADPVAADMDFDAVLCTRPKVAGGMLTGEVDGDILWGPGKARAITQYAQREGVRLVESFAYSNGTEDVPFVRVDARDDHRSCRTQPRATSRRSRRPAQDGRRPDDQGGNASCSPRSVRDRRCFRGWRRDLSSHIGET